MDTRRNYFVLFSAPFKTWNIYQFIKKKNTLIHEDEISQCDGPRCCLPAATYISKRSLIIFGFRFACNDSCAKLVKATATPFGALIGYIRLAENNSHKVVYARDTPLINVIIFGLEACN